MVNKLKTLSPVTSIRFTDHAVRRCQSRGVKLKNAEIAALYGKKTRVQGGLFQRVVIRSSVRKAISMGANPRDLEDALEIPVILDESISGERSIVSVLPRSQLRRMG